MVWTRVQSREYVTPEQVQLKNIHSISDDDWLTLNTSYGLVTRLNSLPTVIQLNPHYSMGILLPFLCFTNEGAEVHINWTSMVGHIASNR